jgi:hypothetical protein
MSSDSKTQIPNDLRYAHRIFSTGKNVRPTAEAHVKLIERIATLTAERDALAERVKRLSAQVEAGARLDSGNCWHRWGLDTCIRRGDHQEHLTKYGYEWDDSCICNGRGCTRCCGPS